MTGIRQKILSYIKISFLISVFLVGSVPNPAAAFEVDFFQGNDILWYTPEAGTCITTAKSYTTKNDIPSLVGNDNAEKIWNFLIEKGLTAEQAAGVMGNIQQESNFNPEAREGNGIGYGIVQWSFGRRSALEAAAAEQSVAVSDLGFQLAYMYQESNSRQVSDTVAGQGYGNAGDNEWDTLTKQKTVEDATVFFHNNFEVSADSPQKVLDVRGGFARSAYESFKDKVPAGVTSTTSSGSSSGSRGGCSRAETFAGGDLAETVLAYAWPTYRPPDFIEKKPEYETAIQKAMSEGRFVGGLEYPGVDCGGFTTTLMVDSGFEPDFNYGGKMSDGAGNTTAQEAWLKANWVSLGSGDTINVADLQPGDIAMWTEGNNGHTYVFVGQIDGFESNLASSSVSFGPGTWRSPMAGNENPTDPKYTWYRKG